jgi:arylsulfatase A-like enzyme
VRYNALTAAVLALMFAGCQAQETTERPPYLDAQSASVDGRAPYTRFDGRGGSLLLTEGWGAREGNGGRGDAGSFAWSVADEVKIIFRSPGPGEYDFYARVNPYQRPAADGVANPQTIALTLDGEPAGSLTLERGWHSIRMALPRFEDGRGLRQLAIRFGYTTSPKSRGQSLDNRELGVSFSEAAIVRREIQDARQYVDALEDRLQSQDVVIDAQTPWEFPLPANSETVVHLEDVESSCAHCLLAASLVRPDGSEDAVWTAPINESSHRDIPVTTGAEGINRLRVSLDDECPSCSPDAEAELSVDGGFISSAGKEAPTRRPNVFIYVVDTLRADALEPYGASPGNTPNLAEFARDAVVYANAHAGATWTLPSSVSLLTGVYPDRHLVMKGDIRFSEDRTPSLPRRLSAEGYQTVGISQSFIVSDHFGLAAPFERFFLNDQLNTAALRSQRVRRFLAEWLYGEWDGSSPMLTYIHTVDPHAPYRPTGPFRRLAREHPGHLDGGEYEPQVFMRKGYVDDAPELRHLKALYEGEVMYADAEFGKFIDLLKQLNLYEDSVVVFASDHGEEFGEHGGLDHGRTVYEELLHVPLIVKYPGLRDAGTRSESLVSTVDVAPTILEIAGIPTADLGLDGRPLPPFADPPGDSRILFAREDVGAAGAVGPVNYSVYFRGALKCIHSESGVDQFGNSIPAQQAFDLSEDPAEAKPAASPLCAALSEAWTQDRFSDPRDLENKEVSQKSLEKLRSLGYIQ